MSPALSTCPVTCSEPGSIRSGGGSAALLSSVPTLTDHPILPVLASDIRLFSAGLVIERTHTASLPIMICMEQHVAEMWTVGRLSSSHYHIHHLFVSCHITSFPSPPPF